MIADGENVGVVRRLMADIDQAKHFVKSAVQQARDALAADGKLTDRQVERLTEMTYHAERDYLQHAYLELCELGNDNHQVGHATINNYWAGFYMVMSRLGAVMVRILSARIE